MALRSALRLLLALASVWTVTTAHAQASTPTPVEVNLASEADLDSLRGVGPALTARILAQRAQAPFADWADLVRRVKGIRPATAGQLAAQGLTVNGQGLPARPAPPTPADTPAESPR